MWRVPCESGISHCHRGSISNTPPVLRLLPAEVWGPTRIHLQELPSLLFPKLRAKPFTSSPEADRRLSRAAEPLLPDVLREEKKKCFKGHVGVPNLLHRKLMESQVLHAINSICASHSQHTLLHSFQNIHALCRQVLLQKWLNIRNTEVSNSRGGDRESEYTGFVILSFPPAAP